MFANIIYASVKRIFLVIPCVVLSILILIVAQMPPPRRSVSQIGRRAIQARFSRSQESLPQRERDRLRHMQRRSREREAQHAHAREIESSDNRRVGENEDRLRHATSRSSAELNLEAFNYNTIRNYQDHPKIVIGAMDKECGFCHAKKFDLEPPGMCCSGGKVKLHPINPPPEDLMSLLNGTSPLSSHFLSNIRRYNSCFQMTSFGAKIIEERGFMPTFKVQGQVYHKAGALLPNVNQPYKFLQIYFMGDENLEASLRCEVIPGTKRDLVMSLQRFFHQQNG